MRRRWSGNNPNTICQEGSAKANARIEMSSDKKIAMIECAGMYLHSNFVGFRSWFWSITYGKADIVIRGVLAKSYDTHG